MPQINGLNYRQRIPFSARQGQLQWSWTTQSVETSQCETKYSQPRGSTNLNVGEIRMSYGTFCWDASTRFVRQHFLPNKHKTIAVQLRSLVIFAVQHQIK